jgi:hypothetical protein
LFCGKAICKSWKARLQGREAGGVVGIPLSHVGRPYDLQTCQEMPWRKGWAVFFLFFQVVFLFMSFYARFQDFFL